MVNILVETCSITTLLTSVVVLSTEDVFINRVGLLSLIPRFNYILLILQLRDSEIRVLSMIGRSQVRSLALPWGFALVEDYLFENRILRRVFGPKRDENGEWRRFHNEELHGL